MDLIIGAGITGLSYAKYCGHNDYIIIEKNNHIGGYCNTIYQDGFTWDYSGHFFHFKDEDLKNELYKRFDEKDILTLVKQTFIYYNDLKIDFPFQQNIHQLPKEEFIDCLYDFYFTKENKQSSFKDMVISRFGNSICEKFLLPYNEKLYACDLNNLDQDAMGRFFPHVNLDDIISNFRNKGFSSYNTKFTYPKKGALQYINSVASDVDLEKCSIEEELLYIDVKEKIAYTNKRKIPYKRLISTIPLVELLDKCNIKYDKDIYTWNKVLVFNLGFDSQSTDIVSHWLYIPNKKFIFYRVGFYSNIMKQDRMSLYVEVGYSRQDDIDIENTRQRVLSDLKEIGVITNQKLISEHNIILDPAYVHINREMFIDKEKKLTYLKNNDIYSIGRYGNWKYCSIEDNIIEARLIAKLINK